MRSGLLPEVFQVRVVVAHDGERSLAAAELRLRFGLADRRHQGERGAVERDDDLLRDHNSPQQLREMGLGFREGNSGPWFVALLQFGHGGEAVERGRVRRPTTPPRPPLQRAF